MQGNAIATTRRAQTPRRKQTSLVAKLFVFGGFSLLWDLLSKEGVVVWRWVLVVCSYGYGPPLRDRELAAHYLSRWRAMGDPGLVERFFDQDFTKNFGCRSKEM